MQETKKTQEDINELYRVLTQEVEEFQEYLDILEALPQEPLFPTISVESGSTTAPTGDAEHA